MIGRSPNEIANDLSRLHRDARLRRLKAVRDAASRVQQQRLLSFRKHFVREKTIQEEAACIHRARITQNALTFTANLTEEMLRQNESFKAHVTMSNLRFDAAIELIRAFRREQQILKSAPAEQRAAAFERAKGLLKRIAAINEKSKLRYAAGMSLGHPYDSIHELTPASPVDYRITRIHADPGTVDAVSLARIEDDRHRERMQQAEAVSQRQAQVAELRAEAAADAVRSRRTATEVRALLQEAVVQDRQRRWQIARQRSALPPRPRQSQIKRAFESAVPELRTVQRDQNVKRAQQRLRLNSAVRASPRNGSRPESPDDLLERFTGEMDAAVVPNDLLQTVVKIADDTDSLQEDDQTPAAMIDHGPETGFSDLDPSSCTILQRESCNEREKAPTAASASVIGQNDQSSVVNSSHVNNERRPIAFNVTFDDEMERPKPKHRRSPSPSSVHEQRSQSSSTETSMQLDRSESLKTGSQSEPVTELGAVLPSEFRSSDSTNSAVLSAEPIPTSQPSVESPSAQITDIQLSERDSDVDRAATPPSEHMPGSLQPAPEPNSVQSVSPCPSPGLPEDSSTRVGSMSELPMPSPIRKHEEGTTIYIPESIPADRASAGSTGSSNASSELGTIVQSSRPNSPFANDIMNDLMVDNSLLPSVDLSLDDLDELDRRAEELLRSHIPTTPQLLALSRDPEEDALDFRLDEDGDDYAIRMLGVDSEELAASFAQTLDETLQFLRQSRQEIDNLRVDMARDSHQETGTDADVPISSSGSTERELVEDDQPRMVAATLVQDTRQDDAISDSLNPSVTQNAVRDSASEQESRTEGSVVETTEQNHHQDLNTSAVSSERTTDDDRSSSLQEQFRANVALIERIEQRRAEVRRRRQSH